MLPHQRALQACLRVRSDQQTFACYSVLTLLCDFTVMTGNSSGHGRVPSPYPAHHSCTCSPIYTTATSCFALFLWISILMCFERNAAEKIAHAAAKSVDVPPDLLRGWPVACPRRLYKALHCSCFICKIHAKQSSNAVTWVRSVSTGRAQLQMASCLYTQTTTCSSDLIKCRWHGMV